LRIAQCGAWHRHVDGVAMRSCGMLVSEAVGSRSPPSKALRRMAHCHKVQQGLDRQDVPQCGYCQSGMSHGGRGPAQGEAENRPTKDIDRSLTNICRCGTLPAGA